MKVCPICAEEIEATSCMYYGHEVHPECCNIADKPETALEYAVSYADKFAEYLKETLFCTDHPKEREALITLLEDFKASGYGDKPFDSWICDNAVC